MSDDVKLGPPPVEPIGDLAWVRLERELWARLDAEPSRTSAPPPPERRWVRPVAAIAAIAATVAIVVAATRGGDAADPVATTPPSEGLARIVAGASPSSATFGDTHLTLDPDTAVIFDRDATAIVERGATWFEVAPRGAKPPFIVVAGDATITVVGTRFRVARHDERVEVAVEHGMVRVRFRAVETFVGAGQTWESPLPAQPVPQVDEPVDEQARFEALGALEPRDPQRAIAGYVELARGSSRWSELALFAAGRLASDRKDPRATALLTDYVRRFPAGANVLDAKRLLDRK